MLSGGGNLFYRSLILVVALGPQLFTLNAKADQTKCGATFYCFSDVTFDGINGTPPVVGTRFDVVAIHKKNKTIEKIVEYAPICELTRSKVGRSFRMCIELEDRVLKKIQNMSEQNYFLQLVGSKPVPNTPDNNAINPTADVETANKIR